jgi:phospholipid-translocating ATPase
VWFWTGVYSSFTSSDYFYKAAAEVFGQASFWAITALSVMLALLPRFCIKVAQKIYFPYDVDIIREQVRQGKFDYLDRPDEPLDSMSKGSSASSSEITKPSKHTHYPSIDEDQRPIYPPSVAPTSTTTHNPRSQNGSDGTDFTRHRSSFDQLGPRVSVEPPRPSFDQLGPRVSVDRPRPSFDRLRTSMDRVRPSFEASNDFTSAALLTRLESSQSFGPLRSRRNETPPPPHAL